MKCSEGSRKRYSTIDYVLHNIWIIEKVFRIYGPRKAFDSHQFGVNNCQTTSKSSIMINLYISEYDITLCTKLEN